MTKQDETTARPWTVREWRNGPQDHGLGIWAGPDQMTEVADVIRQANAAFIVKAVNSHDDLVLQLDAMVSLASPFFTDALEMQVLRCARAAILKAEKGD